MTKKWKFTKAIAALKKIEKEIVAESMRELASQCLDELGIDRSENVG